MPCYTMPQTSAIAALEQLLEQRRLANKPFPWQAALFLLVKYDRRDNALRIHNRYYSVELLKWLGPISSPTAYERLRFDINLDLPGELINGSCVDYGDLLNMSPRIVAGWLLLNRNMLTANCSPLVRGVSPRIQNLRNCNEPLL